MLFTLLAISPVLYANAGSKQMLRGTARVPARATRSALSLPSDRSPIANPSTPTPRGFEKSLDPARISNPGAPVPRGYEKSLESTTISNPGTPVPRGYEKSLDPATISNPGAPVPRGYEKPAEGPEEGQPQVNGNSNPQLPLPTRGYEDTKEGEP